MFKGPLGIGIAVCLLAGAPATRAQTVQAETPADAVPEQVVVVGQRPGPGLWKIAKGEHTLWVFGTYSPLPKKMQWRSQQVESILAQAQEYIAPPSLTVGVGFFRQFTVLPYLFGIQNNPNGATLREVLPADVYQRWLPLRERYFGKDESMERMRPIFAAFQLHSKAMARAGLEDGQAVQKTIDGLIKQHKLKVTVTGIKTMVDDPVAAIKDFKRAPLDDAACFASTLSQLESDVEAMRVRANAWAIGDIHEIEKFNYAEREADCNTAMAGSALVKNRPQLNGAQEQTRANWIAAAENALTANRTSFAVLPLHNILGKQSLVAALQEKGYSVTGPE